LCDDHTIMRVGLRALLSAEPDFLIIGEASDGLEAVELAERLKPLVVVLDVMMPGINGLEAARQINQRCPNTYIVFLSMHAREAYVVEAFKKGAHAYVLKDSQANDLIQAVRAVLAGHRYLSPPLSERSLKAYLKKIHTKPGREREVLHLTAEGNSSSQIGVRLGISPRTVEIHRANMMRKLGVHSQIEVVRYAFQRGLLPLET
jgi:two-component system response regulator NreC